MAKKASRIPNPLALNMYVLGYDSKKKLVNVNQAVKENLQTYLGQYRMVTDAINIKNAYVINVGVKFSIMTRPNFNKNEVLLRAIETVKTFFDIDRWQLNQPILINNVRNVLDNIEGIQTVKKLEIVNKVGTNENYSEFAYDMNGATIDEVLYPSLDPSIFELKFPDTDIQGRVVTN